MLRKLLKHEFRATARIDVYKRQAQMLPTLRSRCVELKLRPAQEAVPSPQAREDAQALCRAVASRRRGAVTAVAVGLERRRLTREDLAALLEELSLIHI